MTLFEWLSVINAATTVVLVFLHVRGQVLGKKDMAKKMVALADNYPRGIEKLTARMGWTKEQMDDYLKEARKQLKEDINGSEDQP